MSHKKINQRRFACGHVGLGRYCHRCGQAQATSVSHGKPLTEAAVKALLAVPDRHKYVKAQAVGYMSPPAGWQGVGARKARGLPPRAGRT